jgi:hypothetical protein
MMTASVWKGWMDDIDLRESKDRQKMDRILELRRLSVECKDTVPSISEKLEALANTQEKDFFHDLKDRKRYVEKMKSLMEKKVDIKTEANKKSYAYLLKKLNEIQTTSETYDHVNQYGARDDDDLSVHSLIVVVADIAAQHK